MCQCFICIYIGRHCCIYCDISKDSMRMPRDERPPSRQRSLQTLDEDLHRFNANGSTLFKAKLFNNVIDEPMFRIPLTQVIILQFAINNLNFILF